VADRIILTTTVSNLTEVRFYESTIDHIRERHPEVPIELPSLYFAMEKAIANPTHVESSHSNTYVFVDTTTTNAAGDPFRIPVRLIAGTTSGRITTAYFAKKVGAVNYLYEKKP
jgi:hypothetical protein